MRLIIQPNYENVSRWAANYVAARINEFNPTEEKPFILGLNVSEFNRFEQKRSRIIQKCDNFQYG